MQSFFFPAKTFVAMIEFLLKCFEAGLEQLKAEASWLPMEKMCLLLEHGMAYEGTVELHAHASKALITIGSHFPEMTSARCAAKISWLKEFLGHVDLDTRESVAHLLGLASHALPVYNLLAVIIELTSSVTGSQKFRFEERHGVLCALGYITADFMTRESTVSEPLLQSTLKCLVDVVNSETATLASVAMEAIGHIGLRVSLPLLHEFPSGSILTLLREKLTKLLSGDDTEAIEKIVISLGHMSVKETSHLNIALDLIFSLCRSKVEDVLFAAGEALSFLWGGVPVTADVILKTNYTSLSLNSNFLMVDVNALLSNWFNCSIVLKI